MNKNFFKFSAMALGIIALGLIALYGLNYWQEKKNGNNIVPQQKADEIAIIDLPTGEKLVENKTQGYSVRVPSKWTIDATKEQFYSPTNNNCKISSSVSEVANIKTIDDLKNQHDKDILDIGFTVKEKKYDVIKISGYDSLKLTLNTEETGYSVTVETFLKDRIYAYILYSNDNDKNVCNNYFDKFLETVSIK